MLEDVADASPEGSGQRFEVCCGPNLLLHGGQAFIELSTRSQNRGV